jgi:hypothetical protein
MTFSKIQRAEYAIEFVDTWFFSTATPKVSREKLSPGNYDKIAWQKCYLKYWCAHNRGDCPAKMRN